MLAPTGDPQQLHAKLLASFPKEVLQTIAAIVAWAHVRAPVFAHECYGEIGKLRSGLFRWIQIDSNIIGMAGRVPGLDIGLRDNDGCPGQHVEVVAGEFRLLFAHDSDPLARIPTTDYGRTLARSNVWTLFPEAEATPKVASPGAKSYVAFLFHSKSATKGEVPDVLEIRFPDGADGYACDHIKLYELFPDIRNIGFLLNASVGWTTAPAAAAMEERIKEEALPKLRKIGQVGT
jgi:hypothetical protein